MKIKIKDIPKQGLDLQERVSPGEIGLEEDKLYKSVSPLSISAHLEKTDDLILADVEVQGTYEFSCSRCLDPVVQTRTDRSDLSFDYNPEIEEIDLGEEIRQDLVILLSGIVLCREDCKGLCLGCGMNLNREKCKCLDADTRKS